MPSGEIGARYALCGGLLLATSCTSELIELGSFEPFAVDEPTGWALVQRTGDSTPGPRTASSSVYDADHDRAILFGGCISNPDDTWTEARDTWILESATSTAAAWRPLETEGEASGGCAHSAVYDRRENRMIVIRDRDDVRVLEHANGLGGPARWVSLETSGDGPIGLISSSAVYVESTGQVILFGGQVADGASRRLTNDVWILENANAIRGRGEWRKIEVTGEKPHERDGSTASYDSSTNRLIIFGGATYDDPVDFKYFNDVWLLDNASGASGAHAWHSLPIVPATGPPPRRGHSAAYDEGRARLIVFGGCWNGGQPGCTQVRDTWILDGANGGGSTPAWRSVRTGAPVPGKRWKHGSAYNTRTDRLVVFGGEEVPPGFDDVWLLRGTTRRAN